jgi:hypothetical protein
MKPMVWIVTLLIAGLAGGPLAASPGEVESLRSRWRSLLNVTKDESSFERFPYITCFRRAAEDQRIPVPVLLGLAWGESAFDPRARSSKNAIGIMQIRWPGTAGDLGFETAKSLEDPCRNIAAGARYLRGLLDQVDDDIVRALAAYNQGLAAIRATGPGLNRHARWYVRYIYDKTSSVVLGEPPRGTSRAARLGAFTDSAMARVSLERYRLLAWFREGANLALEIQREPSGRYELRVRCENSSVASERERYRRLTGFEPG